MRRLNNAFRTRAATLFLVCFFSVLASAGILAGPRFQFSDYFVKPNGTLLTSGNYAITANIRLASSSVLLWQYPTSSVAFRSNGRFSFDVSSDELPDTVFSQSPLIFELNVDDSVATFPISAAPFSVTAKSTVFAKNVSTNAIYGSFSNFLVSGNLLAGTRNTLFVNAAQKRVGIGNRVPAYTLDIIGTANATDFYLDGVPIQTRFPWRSGTVTPSVFTSYSQVGIGLNFPFFAMHVGATVNATDYLIDGRPLSAAKDWVFTDVNSANIYLSRTGNVGLGTVGPSAKLDVNGGIRLGLSVNQHPGTLRWVSVEDTLQFQGRIDDLDDAGVPTQSWLGLNAIKFSPRINRVVTWATSSQNRGISNGSSLVYTAQSGNLGIGAEASVPLQISAGVSGNSYVFVSTQNAVTPLFSVVASGAVGIGTNAPDAALSVIGVIDADDLYLNGEALRLSLSTGTYWLKNSLGGAYYLNGNVGIGRRDPDSLLEIAAPARQPGVATINPVITVTARSGSTAQASFVMGVDAADNNVFRIEPGRQIGSGNPLFVSYLDRFGIGVTRPNFNVVVSGNAGLLMTGAYESGVSLNVKGPGTRFTWLPTDASIRGGTLTATSPLLGSDWDAGNVGLASVVFGLDGLANGPFGAVFGGASNRARAYSIALGGQSNIASGSVSVAWGNQAVAAHNSTFVWADPSESVFSSTAERQFLIRAGGGVGIGSSVTYWPFGTNRYAALMIHSLAVTLSDIMALLPVSGDMDTAKAVYIELRNLGYLDDYGHVSALYVPGQSFTGASSVVTSVAGLSNLFDSRYYAALFRLSGAQGVLAFNAAGGFSTGYVGVTENTNVIVSGSVHINPKSDDAATFVVRNQLASANLLALYSDRFNLVSPSIFVSASSNVGIGRLPNLTSRGATNSVVVSTTDSKVQYFLDIQGRIMTTTFIFPDGQRLSTESTSEVWNWEATTPNIFFPSANIVDGRIQATGNVGIGTTSPNATLSLSNRTSIQFGTGGPISPVITYDIDDIDRFSLGIANDAPTVFRMVPGGASVISNTPPFSISGRSVGIMNASPRAGLDVIGNTILSGRVGIGTTEPDSGYTLSVSTMNTLAMLIRESFFGWPSVTRSNRVDVYWDTDLGLGDRSFVGIGTSTPQYELDIAGTINIRSSNQFPASFNTVVLDGGLYAPFHEMANFPRTTQSPSNGPKLYIQNRELVLRTTGDVNISQVMTAGIGPTGSIVLWLTDPGKTPFTEISESPILWRRDSVSTGSISFNGGLFLYGYDAGSRLVVSQNVSLGALSTVDLDGGGRAIGLQSVYTSGTLNVIEGPSLVSNKVSFTFDGWPSPARENWGDANLLALAARPFRFTGLDLKLNGGTQDGTKAYFSVGGYGHGVDVDVSNVSVQSGTYFGYRYPAIFMSGAQENVGIGVTPSVSLEVKGVVNAKAFQISDGLTVGTLNVKSGAFAVLTPNRVGIGKTVPSVEFEINGNVVVGNLKSGGIQAKTMKVGTNSFVVDSSGKVGVASTTPLAQFDVVKSFSESIYEPFTGFNIGLGTSGNAFTAQNNLSGVSINLSALNRGDGNWVTGNRLKGTARGVRIVGSGLNLLSSSTLSGINIVSTGVDVRRRNAVFLGGNVGIGVSNPTFPLQVAGTVYGTNAPQARFLDLVSRASFSELSLNDLVVNGTVTASRIVVTDDVTIPVLSVGDTINLPSIDVVVRADVVIGSATINRGIITPVLSATNVNTVTASFSFVGVGTPISQDNPLAIGGRLRADVATVSQSVVAGTLTVNTANLVVNTARRVGVGTASPFSSLSVSAENNGNGIAFRSYLDKDVKTWATLIHQVPTSSGSIGISFLHSAVYLNRPGSGIVAFGQSDPLPLGRSHGLLFLTSPESQPIERLRISPDGFVGIGTSSPSVALAVAGSANVSGTLAVPSVQSAVVSGSQLMLSAAQILMTPTVDFKSGILGGIYKAAPISAIVPKLGQSLLFTKQSDGALYYGVSASTAAFLTNLNQTSTSYTNALPYFNDDRGVAGSTTIYWSTANVAGVVVGTFSVATDNLYFSNGTDPIVSLLGHVPSTGVTASLSVQRIRGSVTDRVGASNARFYGLNLIAPVGSLNERDVARGLFVDISDSLVATSSLSNGTAVVGTKLAAAFLVGSQSSGNVYIGQASPTVSVADLFLQPANTVAPFYVAVPNSLLNGGGNSGGVFQDVLIDAQGNLGINISPNVSVSLVGVRGKSGLDRLRVMDSSGLPLFFVSSQNTVQLGRGAGQLFSVDGAIRAVSADIRDFSASTLQVSDTFLVDSSGNVGIGTAAPAATLHLQKSFLLPADLTDDFVFSRFDSRTEGTDPIFANVAGTQLYVNPDPSGIFGDVGGSTRTFRGIGVDLSGLRIANNSIVYGLQLSVTESNRTVAAGFLGGNVGVGTSAPMTPLHVDGTLSLSGDALLSVPISGVLSDVTTNRIVADTGQFATMNASGAVINVLDTFVIESSTSANLPSPVSFQEYRGTTLIAAVATFNKLVIPTLNSDMNLSVDSLIASGSAVFSSLQLGHVLSLGGLSVSGSLNLQSPVSIGKRVSVNTGVYVAGQTLIAPTAAAGILDRGVPYLVVDSTSQNALVLVDRAAGVTANLTDTLVGEPNRLSFYNANKRLSSINLLEVTTASVSGEVRGVLQIGTASAQTSAPGLGLWNQSSTVTTTTNGTLSLLSIQTRVPIRRVASATTFNALAIRLGGGSSRLGVNEVGAGINVELHDTFKSVVINRAGQTISGNAFAATFIAGSGTSGNVVVNPASSLVSATSDLAIGANPAGLNALLIQHIQNGAPVTLLGVSENARVGIGSSAATSDRRLLVRSNVSTASALLVSSASGRPVVDVFEGMRVGTGEKATGNSLLVEGSLVSTLFRAKGGATVAVSANFGPTSNPIVVSETGYMGVGTSLPQSHFHLNRRFLVPASLTSDLVMQAITVTVDQTITRNINGVVLVASANGNTTFGALDGSGFSAIGLNLDFSSFARTGNVVMTGVYAHVPVGSASYAAVLLGGNVGVGTSTPRYALDVVGGLQGRSFAKADNFDINSITIDGITGTNLSANRMVISAGSAVVTGTLMFDQTSGSTLNVTGISDTPTWNSRGLIAQSGRLGRLGVGIPFGGPTVGTITSGSIVSSGNFISAGNWNLGQRSGTQLNLSTLRHGTLIDLPGLVLQPAGSTVSVAGDIVASTLKLSPGVSTVRDGFGGLFSSSSKADHLAYTYRSGGSTILDVDVSNIVSGTPNAMAFFGSNGQLTSDGTGLSRFTYSSGFGTGVVVRGVTVNADVPASASQYGLGVISHIGTSSTSRTGATLTLEFGARSGSGSNQFFGLLGNFGGDTVKDDVVTGLTVDLTKIAAESSTELPLGDDFSITGTKASAVFLADRNGDTSGVVGVFLTPYNSGQQLVPSATLHIGDNYTKSRDPRVLLIEPTGNNSLKNTLVVVSSNGRVGVGISAPLHATHIIGTTATADALSVAAEVSSGRYAFAVSNAKRVGIGSASPTSALTVVGGSGVPVLVAGSGAHFIRMSELGYLAIGRASADSLVDVSVNAVANPSATFPAFSVSGTSVGSLRVGRSGTLGVYADPVTFASLSSRVPIRVGTGSATIPVAIVPAVYTAFDSQKSGLVVASRDVYFGVLTSRNATLSESIFTWATPTSGSSLQFSDGSNTVLSLRGGVVSLWSSTRSSANFSVAQPANTTQNPVVVRGPSATYLVVSNNQTVQISTTNATVPLGVGGSTQVSGPIDATTVSSNFLTATVGLTATTNLIVTRTISASITTASPVVMQSMVVSIAEHVSKNVTGLSIVATDNIPTIVDAGSSVITGISVNVSQTSIDNPASPGGSDGVKYGALLTGGSVVITGNGTFVPSLDYDSSLIVSLISAAGDALSTGNFWVLNATNSGAVAASSSVRVSMPTPTLPIVFSGVTQNLGISEVVFSNISGISADLSASIVSDLVQKNILLLVDNKVVLRTTNPTDIYGYAPAVSLGLSTNQAVMIRNMLVGYLTRPVFSLSNQYGLTSSALTPVYLIHGFTRPTGNATLVSPDNPGTLAVGYSLNTVSPSGHFDSALMVSGDIRVGKLNTSVFTEAAGYGSKLNFSGGPILDPVYDSDGNDPLYLARYNSNVGWSELRVVVGEGNSESPRAAFDVGVLNPRNMAWQSSLSVRMSGYYDPAQLIDFYAQFPFGTPTYKYQGGVGIGTANPVAALHVVATRNILSGHVVTNNVVMVQNRNTGTGRILALKNPGNSTNANFISFNKKAGQGEVPESLGTIESDGQNGLQFRSGAADYAEYVLKEIPTETYAPGSVISVDTGRVSLATTGRKKIMVISASPVIAGNWPGDKKADYALVAFMGQVPVKVRGTVRAGDYLVPSGANDGYAVAVAIEDIRDPGMVFGQAWTDSLASVGEVKAVVGVPLQARVAAQQAVLIEKIQRDIEQLNRQNQTDLSELSAQISIREQRIRLLKSLLLTVKR